MCSIQLEEGNLKRFSIIFISSIERIKEYQESIPQFKLGMIGLKLKNVGEALFGIEFKNVSHSLSYNYTVKKINVLD